jgi:hypothetical protein
MGIIDRLQAPYPEVVENIRSMAGEEGKEKSGVKMPGGDVWLTPH